MLWRGQIYGRRRPVHTAEEEPKQTNLKDACISPPKSGTGDMGYRGSKPADAIEMLHSPVGGPSYMYTVFPNLGPYP
jgi:hypothetical protein